MATLPWAQDIGRGWSEADLRQLLTGSSHALIVLDLPAGAPPLKELPKNTSVVLRHTRQSPLNRDKDPVLAWPSTRRKQFNRAEREGMTIEPCSDLSLLVDLHQAARLRKGITSDEQALRNLLQELLLVVCGHITQIRAMDKRRRLERVGAAYQVTHGGRDRRWRCRACSRPRSRERYGRRKIQQ